MNTSASKARIINKHTRKSANKINETEKNEDLSKVSSEYIQKRTSSLKLVEKLSLTSLDGKTGNKLPVVQSRNKQGVDDLDRASVASSASLTPSVSIAPSITSYQPIRRPRRSHNRAPSKRRISGSSNRSGKSGSSYNTSKGVHNEDLEAWWVHSPVWRRVAVFMCLTLFIVGCLQLITAISFFVDSFQESTAIADPYVCRTPDCVDVGSWINRGLNDKVQPCDDFYEFVCGNFNGGSEFSRLDTNPKFATMEKVRTDFRQENTIARILKAKDANLQTIPFYKACLDRKYRNKADLSELVALLDILFRDAFENLETFHTINKTILIGILAGQFDVFTFKLLNNRTYALTPILSWLTELAESVNADAELYRSHFNNTFNITLELLIESSGFVVHPLLTSVNLANSAVESLKVWAEIASGLMTSVPDPDLYKIAESIANNVVFALFEVGKENERSINLPGYRFGLENVTNTVYEFDKRFNFKFATKIRPAIISIWFLEILVTLSPELRQQEFDFLQLNKIVPKSFDLLNSKSDETKCQDSLLAHLEATTFKQLISLVGDQEKRELTEKLLELERQTHRVLRRFVLKDIEKHFDSQDKRYMESFFSATAKRTELDYPYAADVEKEAELLAKHISSWIPTPSHLLNVLTAIGVAHTGRFDSWKKNESHYLKRTKFTLDEMTESIDNSLYPENFIYIPLAFLEPPFLKNDFRILDYSGGVLFMARHYFDLWNLYRANHTKSRSIPKLKPQNDDACHDFFSSTAEDAVAPNVFAFKMGLHLYKNQRIYASLRHRSNNSIAFDVEPFYTKNGKGMEYKRRVGSKWEEISIANYVTINAKKNFKLVHTKVVGLEKYTEDQIYFMAGVRHQCYTHNGPDSYSRHLNNALKQVKEFSAAWKCKPNSPMNPIKKCIKG